MRTFLIASFILLASVSIPTFVFADTQTVSNTSVTQTVSNTGGTSNVQLINPLKATSLEAFLGDILGFVVRIGTIAIILMIVFVGYKFVVAQGKEAEIREARMMLLWTVVGALILLGAQAIASAIQSTVTAISG